MAAGLKDSDPQLKVAALRALYHALIFAKENFNRKVPLNKLFCVCCCSDFQWMQTV